MPSTRPLKRKMHSTEYPRERVGLKPHVETRASSVLTMAKNGFVLNLRDRRSIILLPGLCSESSLLYCILLMNAPCSHVLAGKMADYRRETLPRN